MARATPLSLLPTVDFLLEVVLSGEGHQTLASRVERLASDRSIGVGLTRSREVNLDVVVVAIQIELTVRVVDEVLTLDSELEPLAFRCREALEDREIVIQIARIPQVRRVQGTFNTDGVGGLVAVWIEVLTLLQSRPRIAGQQRHQQVDRRGTQPRRPVFSVVAVCPLGSV